MPPSHSMGRTFLSLGGWLAFLAVALGAFGAHAIRARVSAANLEVWKTAVQYHALHAVALLVVGLLCLRGETKLLRVSGWLFVAGIAIFGGSLYALALSDVKVLGAITPIGGVCFLAGWVCFALAAANLPKLLA